MSDEKPAEPKKPWHQQWWAIALGAVTITALLMETWDDYGSASSRPDGAHFNVTVRSGLFEIPGSAGAGVALAFERSFSAAEYSFLQGEQVRRELEAGPEPAPGEEPEPARSADDLPVLEKVQLARLLSAMRSSMDEGLKVLPLSRTYVRLSVLNDSDRPAKGVVLLCERERPAYFEVIRLADGEEKPVSQGVTGGRIELEKPIATKESVTVKLWFEDALSQEETISISQDEGSAATVQLVDSPTATFVQSRMPERLTLSDLALLLGLGVLIGWILCVRLWPRTVVVREDDLVLYDGEVILETEDEALPKPLR